MTSKGRSLSAGESKLCICGRSRATTLDSGFRRNDEQRKVARRRRVETLRCKQQKTGSSFRWNDEPRNEQQGKDQDCQRDGKEPELDSGLRRNDEQGRSQN